MLGAGALVGVAAMAGSGFDSEAEAHTPPGGRWFDPSSILPYAPASESGVAQSVRDIRARSEDSLKRRFDEREAGLWDRAGGAKDDFLAPQHLAEAIRGVGPGEPLRFAVAAPRDLPQRGTKASAGARKEPASTPATMGLPVGPLYSALPVQAFGLTIIKPGVGALPEVPDVKEPGDPAAPKTPPERKLPPGGSDPDPMPTAETPLPAPLLLFPAGLALLWRRGRKA